MARRSLKPQLNQIRTWVRQGRTDAWIAHQLEVSVREIDSFKKEHDLAPADAPEGDADAGPRLDEEPDLRAEDDALVAAALDAEPEEDEDEPDGDDEGEADGERARARMARPLPSAVADAVAAVAVVAAAAGPSRSRAPSITATRATGCGSTPPSRTTASTPSTGPDTGP